MEKKNILFLHLIQSIGLCLSAVFALGLFYVPSTIWNLCFIAILCVIILNEVLHFKDTSVAVPKQIGSFVMAFCTALSGFLLFYFCAPIFWGISNLTALLLGIAFTGLGFYAFYRFGITIEDKLCRLLHLPLESNHLLPVNLIFSLSAVVFFSIDALWTNYIIKSITIIFILALSIIITLHSPNLLTIQKNKLLCIFSFLSACGIVLFRAEPLDLGIRELFLCVISLPFPYICFYLFYSWLTNIFIETKLFSQISRKESLLYLILFIVIITLTTIIFVHTNAFYGSPHKFDVIYTSDSTALVTENAYLSFLNPENDLRQPLFAIFSTPFISLPYLISRIFPNSLLVTPLFMNLAQIGLLLLANFLLVKLLELKKAERILFMIFSSLSYPCLLFTLMMEQYIIAYFWLVLCLFLLLKKKPQAEIALCGAGGTLLTSLILMPAAGSCSPFRNFKLWFSKMLSLCLSFLIFILFFGRFDILLNFPAYILNFMRFSGANIPAAIKLQQYLSFVSQCILAPGAGADLETLGYPSWQLFLPSGFSIAGLTVLGLCILSAFLNRKDAVSRAAILWLGFSFLILFVLGWGTAENGLILYSLYFGWAIWVLLYRLLQKLKTHSSLVFHVTAAAAVLLFAAVNLPAIYKLIQFACLYYPI